MLKKWIYYTSITLIVAFISSGFKAAKNQNPSWFSTAENEPSSVQFPSKDLSDYPFSNLIYTGKSFTGFKEAIAFKESQGQYKLINSFGYMGKYQFGASALRSVGIKDNAAFLRNPQLQEKAFSALIAKNKWELKDEIAAYEGKIVAGIRMTESGMLAAAHLLGAGSVKKFLKYDGKRKIVDGYGTSLKSYLRKYADYDTSHIIAEDNPVVFR
ncbi:peptidoglycan-binding protein LysM [Flavobacterium pallidum]|uniref:Peptidoglycan-binding protein LysM n=1 Tax=Flavobacterium pallidum TaxID=2172098 RepID=A0A2S1SL92_9FLAO|nr:peptidoglycan-binding protein LysM [Flavobacterium pallidum]AWI27117.1 peptidoglycan-binding protein LysM [Flavobacterium pallidum]